MKQVTGIATGAGGLQRRLKTVLTYDGIILRRRGALSKKFPQLSHKVHASGVLFRYPIRSRNTHRTSVLKEPPVRSFGIMLFQAFDRLVSRRRYRPYLAKDRDTAHNGVFVTITPKYAIPQAIPGRSKFESDPEARPATGAPENVYQIPWKIPSFRNVRGIVQTDSPYHSRIPSLPEVRPCGSGAFRHRHIHPGTPDTGPARRRRRRDIVPRRSTT